MNANPYFAFVLEIISRYFPEKKNIRVLDYGCGNGELIKFLRQNGYDAYGVDVDTFFDDFYSYTDQELLAQKRISVIDIDGHGPWSGQTFDFIISNMVIEHVEDKKRHFAALSRCMSDSGKALLLYPLLESVREGHIRQFFIHWIPRGRLRVAAAYVQKLLGIPRDKGGTANINEFVKEKVGIVDTSCFYETNGVINRQLGEFFDFSHLETEYFIFRAQQKKMLWLVPLLELLSITGISALVFRIYTGAVVVAGKKPI
jgi:2-polyprenyl-3-methyl-5-hydroxy-6-metoxy-1,4-benzoquinol methylase